MTHQQFSIRPRTNARKMLLGALPLVFFLFAACSGSAASPAPPDQVAFINLVPVSLAPDGEPKNDGGENSYCVLNDGMLVVHVVNAGNVPVQEEVGVRVVFDSTSSPKEETGVIPPDFPPYLFDPVVKSLEFSLPAGGFSSDLKFTISVDFKNEIFEGHAFFESDNEVTGICIG